jgi:hypothetical protein
VTDKHAHYLLTVKANQPTLWAQLRQLPWHDVPVLHRSRDRGHGRVETRSLKVVTVAGLGFPHPRHTLPITRRVRDLHRRRWRTVVVDAVTDLTFTQASPAQLADLLRGHWTIENTHYLGLLAATTARWDAAAGHFQAAMQMSTRMAAPVFLANSRYHYAQTLLATPGREQEARELIDQALAGAHALGVRLQLERRSPGTPASQPQR